MMFSHKRMTAGPATYSKRSTGAKRSSGGATVGASRAHRSMFDSEYDYLFKFVVVGDSGVGKSCLVERFSEGRFSTTFVPTIGVDFKIRSMDTAGGKKVKLQIWDTAGQERFRAITASYYRGGNAIVLCYDTSDRTTFDNLRMWLKEIRHYARPDCRIMLVGTKTDVANRIKCDALRARVATDDAGTASASPAPVTSATAAPVDDDVWWSEKEEATALAAELGVPLVRCSAKNGDGVEELFTQFAESLVKEHVARTSFPAGPGSPGDSGNQTIRGDTIRIHEPSSGIMGMLSRFCFN